MRKWLTVGLWLVILTAQAKTFEHIAVLGDSLSDTGNLYKYLLHLVPKSPPYYEGRFSNGPAWSENVYYHYFPSKKDELKYNFAVGGAPAVFSFGNTLPFSLATELDDYLYLHSFHDKDTTLYVIWIGANNYVPAPGDHEKITSEVVDAIGKSIERLIEHGGEMFLVPNLPDLGNTPFARNHGRVDATRDLTNLHNAKLKAKLAALSAKHPNVSVVPLDVHRLFEDVLHNPAQFGITNTHDACYDAEVFSGFQVNQHETLSTFLAQAKQAGLSVNTPQMTQLLQSPDVQEAVRLGQQATRAGLARSPSCEGYLFWDRLHPTAYVHQRLASYAIEAIDAAGLLPRS